MIKVGTLVRINMSWYIEKYDNPPNHDLLGIIVDSYMEVDGEWVYHVKLNKSGEEVDVYDRKSLEIVE